jgi:hypothetical protein
MYLSIMSSHSSAGCHLHPPFTTTNSSKAATLSYLLLFVFLLSQVTASPIDIDLDTLAARQTNLDLLQPHPSKPRRLAFPHPSGRKELLLSEQTLINHVSFLLARSWVLECCADDVSCSEICTERTARPAADHRPGRSTYPVSPTTPLLVHASK